MRLAIVFLVVGIVLLGGLYWQYALPSKDGTLDFHFHDTYFVVEKKSAIIGTALVLLSLFAIGGCLGTGFRNRSFVSLLLICVAFILYIIFKLV